MGDHNFGELMRQWLYKIAQNKARNLRCKSCDKEPKRNGSAYGEKCAADYKSTRPPNEK